MPTSSQHALKPTSNPDPQPNTQNNDSKDIQKQVQQFAQDCDTLYQEISKMMVGQTAIIKGVITALLAGGNVLLEGVPGLGKTMLVRTLAQTLGVDFSRIQFTPDLMPTDILGTTILIENNLGQKEFKFERGPIFSNIVLADEINRATPKTQSAMLEAMQERSVTIANETLKLDDPFFVLATQNPLEMEGTYPLPEAQLDRFLFKLHVEFPNLEELHDIMDRTTSQSQPSLSQVLSKERLLAMKTFARTVPIAKHIQDYALRLLQATHPNHPTAPNSVKQYVRFGSSPRGAQGILKASKVNALMEGRFNVSSKDIQNAALGAFRHRLVRNFEGEAEGILTDDLLQDIFKHVQPSK